MITAYFFFFNSITIDISAITHSELQEIFAKSYFTSAKIILFSRSSCMVRLLFYDHRIKKVRDSKFRYVLKWCPALKWCICLLHFLKFNFGHLVQHISGKITECLTLFYRTSVLCFLRSRDIFSFPISNDRKQRNVCIFRKPYAWIETVSLIYHEDMCVCMILY